MKRDRSFVSLFIISSGTALSQLSLSISLDDIQAELD